jgi:hypothetical protein
VARFRKFMWLGAAFACPAALVASTVAELQSSRLHARYQFSSALPVQLLQSLAPQLLASLDGGGRRADSALRDGGRQ